MAVELATGYVSLVPSARGFSGKLRREIDGTGIGKTIGEDIDRGLTPRIGAVLRRLGGLAAATGAVIGAAAGGLALWGTKSAGDLQQTQIAFEGILGSGEAAAQMVANLRQFAATTPFEFPQLADAARQLLGVGFAAQDVIPIMTKIGNVAATLGVSGEGIERVVRALGQMKGKGRASAEELQQISEAIPGFSAIGAIAESMGISTAEAFDLMAQGAIPADAAIQAILEGMERFPGAAGAMERQSQTLLGVLSTFKDTARDALVNGITPALPAISQAIQSAIPAISAGLQGLGTAFGQAFSALIPALEALMPAVQTIGQGIGSLLTTAFQTLAPVIEALGPPIQDLVHALGPLLGAVLAALAPVLQALGPQLVNIGTAIAGALLPVVQALAPVLEVVASAIAAVLGRLADSGILETFAQLLAAILQTVTPLAEALAGVLVDALDGLLAALRPVIRELAGALMQALRAIQPVLPDLAEAFGQIIRAVIPLIPPLLEILRALLPLIPVVAQLAALLAGGLAEAMRIIAAVLGPVVSGISAFVTAIASALQTIVGAVTGFIGTISAHIDTVVSFFAGLPGRILGALGDLGGLLVGAGSSLVGGFADGIRSMWGAVASAFGSIIEVIRRVWNEFVDIWNSFQLTINWPSVDLGPLGEIGGGSTTIGLPDLPKLSAGALITRPALAMIGEGTSDEAVLPLSTSIYQRIGRGIARYMPASGDDTTLRRWERAAADMQAAAALLAAAGPVPVAAAPFQNGVR